MRWIMERLPELNLALFALQLMATWALFPRAERQQQLQQEHASALTPAAYAWWIWNAIDLFTLMTVITDASFPGLSLIARASRPNVLRVLFALSCVLNVAEVVLFSLGLVNLATLAITLLWLVLLPIYLFTNLQRDQQPAFQWRPYACSELGIRVYFAGVMAVVVLNWTVTCEDLVGDDHALDACLALLSVYTIVTLLAVVYGRDPVVGLMTVWTLTAMAQKTERSDSDQARPMSIADDVGVQAAATLATAVVLATVLASGIAQAFASSRYSREWLAYMKVTSTESPRSYGTGQQSSIPVYARSSAA